MAELLPVHGAPVLELRPPTSPPLLLLADLHLGLGGNERLSEGPPEASAPGMAEALLGLARARSAPRVVVLGDIKHPILGTPRSLQPVVFDFFSTLLSGGLSIDIVLGNHDQGLVRHLPREVTVHPASGFVLHRIGVFHGHRWPSNAVLRCPALVVGHLHPGFRLAPSASDATGKARCWIRVSFPPARPPAKRRRRHIPTRASNLIVLPAFNPVAGIEALNRERPRRGRSFLFRRFIARGEARAYLLDGTDLGLIPTRPDDPPTGSPH